MNQLNADATSAMRLGIDASARKQLRNLYKKRRCRYSLEKEMTPDDELLINLQVASPDRGAHHHAFWKIPAHFMVPKLPIYMVSRTTNQSP